MNLAARPLPGADEVHLWQAALDVVDPVHRTLVRVLSAAERDRAARHRQERDRRRMAAARGWLRHLLGAYLDVDPAELEFDHAAHGKPRLANAAAEGLRFNLSHSGGVALYAVAWGREVGVDVEAIDPGAPVASLARRFLDPDEAIAVLEVAGPRRVAAFFDGWVRREAHLKAMGVGLTMAEEEPDGPRRWTVRSVAAGVRVAAAVAVEGHASIPAAPLTLSFEAALVRPMTQCAGVASRAARRGAAAEPSR